MNLAARGGVFGTKVITHFFYDYISTVRDFALLRDFAPGLQVDAIVLDRADKVAQAVSGDLAAGCGQWHVESGADAARYFNYRQQSFILDFARELFPRRLELEYGRDLAAGDLGAIAARIGAHLGLKELGSLEGRAGQAAVKMPKAAARQKIANDENQRRAERFSADFAACFGRPPG